MAGKVFLSYAREDLDMVRWEAQTISMLGHEVFLDVDSLRGGQTWPAALLDEIRTADRFILFWSAFSARSDWVAREYTEALAVRTAKCAAGDSTLFLQVIRLDKEALPETLAHIQSIDRSIEERVVLVTDEVQSNFLNGGLADLFKVGTILHMQTATPRTVRVVAQKAEAALLASLQDHPPRLPAESRLPTKFAFPVYRRRGTHRAIIFIPTFLGSRLCHRGQQIWLNYFRLLTGQIRHLAIGTPHVVADEILQLGCGMFLEQMALTTRLLPWPYDWRLSVVDIAYDLARFVEQLLAEEPDCEPVFVGHGQGCNVLRAFATYHRDLWNKARSGEAPVVYVSPIEHGTWAAAEMLLGNSELIEKLGILDLRHSAREVRALFANFPGLLDMLPSTSEADLFDPAWWQGKPNPPQVLQLEQARETRQALQAAIDPGEIVCVVGESASTIQSLRLERGRFVKVGTAQGDGVSPWALGLPSGARIYRARLQASELLDDPLTVRAIADLINHNGTTDLPQHSAPAARK